MISAVLDACVLYPVNLRDFLLWLGYSEVFFPFWTEKIQDEWIRNLLKKRPELKERLKRTRQRMAIKFPYSCVRGHEPLIPVLQLPDMKDRHVLAAAIHAKAKYIVTFNLDDFPQSVLELHGIETLSPDDFVLRLIRQAPTFVLQATQNHHSDFLRPPLSASEYFAMLERQGLSQTVAFLREHEHSI